MLPPLAVARDFISTWEGGHSVDPLDAGNWTGGKCRVGRCLGSNHGVTSATLATARGVPVERITAADMAGVTLDRAAQIAVDLFYRAPGMGKLPWDPVTAPVLDFGWGTGPRRAALTLQHVVGAPMTGRFDDATARAYLAWLSHRTLASAATAFLDARDEFYRGIAGPGSTRARYLKGWLRRTAWFRPGGDWWKRMGAA